jgi:arylsulfatase A-like enzyme
MSRSPWNIAAAVALLATTLVAVGGTSTFDGSIPPAAAAEPASISCDTPTGRCNILVIETDDQSFDSMMDPVTLEPRASFMPLMHEAVTTEAGWYVFTQARAQDPLCGPSRWGQFLGQTSAHHGMTCNDRTKVPATMQGQAVSACAATAPYRANRDKTYLAALRNAGYWNSYVGKSTNWYPCGSDVVRPRVYAPFAGVDDWHVVYRQDTSLDGDFDLIESDTGRDAVKTHVAHVPGDSDYSAYVLRDKTLNAVDRCASQAQPCFLSYFPLSGHRPGTPPEDYDPGAVVPLPAHHPSFNEGCPLSPRFGLAGTHDPDISDKPSFMQSNIRCFEWVANLWTRSRWQEPLQATDRAIATILQRLRDAGLYDSTIVIFTSDHGFSYGEHNHLTKEVAYDDVTRVPFFVRVPGTTGGTVDALTYLPDLTATLYDIAEATPLVPTDGVSVLPLVTGEAATIHPEGVLGSHLQLTDNDPALADVRPWYAWYQDCSVSGPNCLVLIRYETGEQELYDIVADPYQLTNLLPNPITGYPGVEGWDLDNPLVSDIIASLDAHIATGA